MKRSLLLILAVALSLTLAGCGKTMTAPDGLIAKALEVIPVSEADTIDLRIVGSVEKADGKALVWFMSGNDRQAHYYLPMECILKGADRYEYVRVGKPMERGADIAVYPWEGGYAFLINNESCTSIHLTDSTGDHVIDVTAVDSDPFAFYWEEIPTEYTFRDDTGNEIR